MSIDTSLYRHIPLQAQADGWEPHTYSFSVTLGASRSRVWEWLNTPETFTKGQIWPYSVEFVSPDPEIEPIFLEGVHTIHHGPFLHVAGVLSEVRPDYYRDLQYFYGSFVLGMSLIRPARLQFWLQENTDGYTMVQGQMDSYVQSYMKGFWTFTQKMFWGQFKGLMRRSV